ncbi:MAG: response regulator [Alphaproteobacteria bacterium]|nr:response regulator [Alphaproteobacteria bacterium]
MRSADRGARLTQQLLAYARRQALQPVTADLNALFGDIAELLRRAAGDSVDTTIEYAAGRLCCELDPAQFEAAAINLVVARAFEPFYTTKDIGRGSGLRLSTVYGFARQSGGGVRLDSSPAGGTCVAIYRRESRHLQSRRMRTRPADGHPRGAGSVLVVEDDEEVRQVSVAMLRELGYRVLVANDGPGATRLLQKPDRIDLMFTDLIMTGGITGAALARQAQLTRLV